MPKGLKVEDLKIVFDTGGERAQQVMARLNEIANQAEAPASSVSTFSEAPIRHGSVTVNLKTREETILYEDELYLEQPSTQDDTSVPDYDSPLSPHAQPPSLLRSTDWTEENPQNYADTKSTCKLYAQKNGQVYQSSGFKVGPRYVASAGHAIYQLNWEYGGQG